MYTTRWCGYCVRAKTLLDVARARVRGDLARRRSRASAARCIDLTGGWTVPQILIDGRPIGGYTELWQLDRSGELERAARSLRPSPGRWQLGQYQVPRPAARIFSIGVPHRSHGSPSRP